MSNQYVVSKALRELDAVEKGLFKTATGAMKEPIKGSWKTRHFPKRTAQGRRQLRDQSERKSAGAAAKREKDRQFDAMEASSQRVKNAARNQNLYGGVGGSAMTRAGF